ncbi:endospore germination permease [Desulfotomaculum defluvii]
MKTISNRQFIFILIIFVTSTADILLPSITVGVSGRDAWLSIIGAAIIGSIIIYIQAKLAVNFPGRFLPEYANTLLGPYLGTLLVILYLLFLVIIILGIISELMHITSTVFLRETPEIIFTLFIAMSAGYAVYLGIEVIARVVEFAFIPGILIRLGIIFLVFSDLEVQRFLPILEQGIAPVLQGTFRIIGWFGEGIIVLFLSHHVKEIGKIAGQMVMAIWFIAFLALLGSLTIGNFGPYLAAYITFPLFEMVRIVELGGIQGLDAVIMTFWYSATLFKVVVLLYIIVITLQNFTKQKNKNTYVIPLVLIFTVLPVSLFAEMSNTIEFLESTWPGFALTYELIIPTVLLLLTFINKNIRGETYNEGRN